MKIKFLFQMIAFGLFVGCSSSAWQSTGQEGPWCAANVKAQVFIRKVPFTGMTIPDERMAFKDASGTMNDTVSLHHELDNYFTKCTFINQWPSQGTISDRNLGSVREHLCPFDLYLISINPTVVLGVEKPDPKLLSRSSAAQYPFVDSTFLIGLIEVRTFIPIQPDAKVVWFSPNVDGDLHEVDLQTGTASFSIGMKEQIILRIEKTYLKTLRN